MHVHVDTKNGEYEVKIDISGDEPVAMRTAKDERITTTKKHTKRAMVLCRSNLEFLKAAARKYYEAQ